MKGIQQRCGVVLAVALALIVATGCDETYELDITFPTDGMHFTGAEPYSINLNMWAWAGAILGQSYTAGTVYVNDDPVVDWEEQKPSSHPFELELSVPLQGGQNVIRAASDNGQAEDSVTVWLDL